MEKVFYCVNCGRAFTSNAHKAERCPECRQERIKQLARKNYYRKKYGQRKGADKKSINEIMRELKAYNDKHKTHLSYGQYVSLIEGR